MSPSRPSASQPYKAAFALPVKSAGSSAIELAALKIATRLTTSGPLALAPADQKELIEAVAANARLVRVREIGLTFGTKLGSLCDANLVMAEAFASVMGRPFDVQSEADRQLWNEAWGFGKAFFAATLPR